MILVLGGTAEARALAALLVDDGLVVVSSLAGRVTRPRLPVGEVRVGGFGGVDGLSAYLQANSVMAVVDATHPFAARISANAVAACSRTGVPLLRLARPGWESDPDADHWHWVATNEEAAVLTAALGVRPFLTVGRQGLAAYAGPLAEHEALVRVVDPPEIALPSWWTLLTERGPYDLEGERARMEGHRADVLVTKDSGGRWTYPKLAAAGALGLAVVVVRRPPSPAWVSVVERPGDAAAWVRATAAG
ncbi:MAG: cobalt-precorrin-6A reductase [Nocardioidaceae bacterium]|nr:cobalt-precorrin-6A reductase [Nocardioidaceae bacterium]